MRRTFAIVFALFAAGAASIALSADSGASARSIAPPARIPYPVDLSRIPVGTPVATSTIPKDLRRAVADDAAKRFNVPVSAVVLARAERVTWPDGSLGCPEPGRSYLQAQVAGFRLVARTAAGELLYHTDGGGTFASCALPPGVTER
jgi:hypothetical protein